MIRVGTKIYPSTAKDKVESLVDSSKSEAKAKPKSVKKK